MSAKTEAVAQTAKEFALAFEASDNWSSKAHSISASEETELRQELSLQESYMQQYCD